MILAVMRFRARFGLQKYNSNSNPKKQNKQNRFKSRGKNAIQLMNIQIK